MHHESSTVSKPSSDETPILFPKLLLPSLVDNLIIKKWGSRNLGHSIVTFATIYMWKKDKRPQTPVTLSVDNVNCSRCKRVCSANENSMTSDQDKS